MQSLVSAALAATAIPTAALLLASPSLVLDAGRQRRSSSGVLAAINRVILAGRLIHELQRERGLSVAFLSKPESDQTALAQQRAVTSDALHAFDDAHRHTPCGAAVTNALTSLAAHRQAIDGRIVTGPQAAMGYAGRIGALLDLIDHGVKQSARGRLARLGAAYLNLVSAKECAGQERALLTGLLAAPAIEGSARRQVLDLQERQTMLLRLFAEGAGADLARFAQATLADPDRVITALRKAALAEDATARPHAALWFEASTRRIDALKDVEMRLESTLSHAATLAHGRAANNQRVVMAALAASVGVLGGLASTTAGVW